jgi:flagella basal body P-ring formation protein FlgA
VLDTSDVSRVVAEAARATPLFVTPPNTSEFEVTHQHVRTRLEQAGVNLAHVLLTGAAQCSVTVLPEETTDPVAADARQQRPPLVRQRHSVASSRSNLTLADVVRNQLQQEFHKLGGDIDVRFERSAAQYVDLTTPPYEFVVRSRGSRTLGMREFQVTIRQDGEVQRTVPMFARVRLLKDVIVARGPLNIGSFIKPEDVDLERRVFENVDEVGLDSVGAAVGQQLKRYVPEGEMVSGNDLKPVDLVKRSRPVNIIGGQAGISTRVTGYALESGTYGETVNVRIGDRRDNYRVVRGEVTGVGTVRMVTN